MGIRAADLAHFHQDKENRNMGQKTVRVRFIQFEYTSDVLSGRF